MLEVRDHKNFTIDQLQLELLATMDLISLFVCFYIFSN